MRTARQHSLQDHRVVITRPTATASALAARVRRLGGTPMRVPGMAVLPMADDASVIKALRAALADEVVIFTSPAAVHFAARLLDLHTAAHVMSPGHATAQALRRAGVGHIDVPARHDSEGMLQHPLLRDPRGRGIALIGAADGRELLGDTLRERGACVRQVHVYRRAPPRITRRHVAAIRTLEPPFHVLLSSVRTVAFLQQALPADTWAQLCQGIAVCSSERVADAASRAGFRRRRVAASAHGRDLVQAVVAAG